MAEAPSGNTGINLLFLFLVIGALFVIWIQGGGPARAKNEGLIKDNQDSSLSSSVESETGSSEEANRTAGESKYKGQVRLESGTAASTEQPGEEYIVLSADYNNTAPVKIGGWVLANGRSERSFDVNGNLVKGQSVYVAIPEKGVALYNPYKPASNILASITLKPGEQAMILTGQIPTMLAVPLKDNFKINRCLGYIVDKTEYIFPFPIDYNCPQVEDMLGISSLSDACYDFARSISSCHEPKEYYVEDYGNCLESNCDINSACQAIVKRSLNFQSCFNQFSHDKDFVGPEWRIFLKRTWELWDSRRETIYLYDSTGKLVDKLSY